MGYHQRTVSLSHYRAKMDPTIVDLAISRRAEKICSVCNWDTSGQNVLYLTAMLSKNLA